MRIAGFKAGTAWWNRSALAGLAGGVVMAAYEMVAAAASGHGAWWPLNLIGGAVPYFRPYTPGLIGATGGLPLAEAGQFWPGTTVGAALHLMTSMAWGLGYGLLLALVTAYVMRGVARSYSFALLAGLVWGVASWLGMGMVAGPWLSPSLSFAEPGPYFGAHMAFGLVTAFVFTALVRRPRVSVMFAPARSRDLAGRS